MPPPDARGFCCPTCSRVFGRPEHLKRHVRAHGAERPFHCSTCDKGFTRSDALRRHETTHQDLGQSRLGQGARACENCAKARVRCAGHATAQCTRCQQRGLDCRYPETPALLGAAQIQPQTDVFLGFPVGLDPSTAARAPPGSSLTPGDMRGQTPQQSADNIDPDFWDPSMLASTNWLNGIMDDVTLGSFGTPNFDMLGGNAAGNEIPSALAINRINGSQVNLWGKEESNGLPDPPSTSPHSIQSRGSVSYSAVTEATTAANTSEASLDPTEAGQYYVDGEPARLPRVKRRKTSSFTAQRPRPPSRLFSLGLNLTFELDATLSYALSNDAYGEIQRNYQRLCIDPNSFARPFEMVVLPSRQTFEYLISLYSKNFAQTQPFVHQATLRDEQPTTWLLCLTMAAIGSHYVDTDVAATLAVSLHDFVRRIFVSLEEENYVSLHVGRPDAFDQARLLHLLGLAYSGDERACQVALQSQQRLQSIYHTASQDFERCRNTYSAGYGSEKDLWDAWRQRESLTRLAYSAWLLESMWTYHFGVKPLLSLQDGLIPLPCNDRLWQAENVEEWVTLGGPQSLTDQACPSLAKAMHEIYVDKRLPRERGEFARILMIHALFHRSWEVERYYSNPLSRWDPSAARENSAEILPNSAVWLPSVPVFAKWQNSACDVLDILHWQANAAIGRASGLEHPTVMHLHIARVILLAPYDRIVGYARWLTTHKSTALSGSGALQSALPTTADSQWIQKWAVHHQYKARLAVIHAGVLLWHVRRYSIDGFYEPSAVALAALTLWAFGSFSGKQMSSAGRDRSRESQTTGQGQLGTTEQVTHKTGVDGVDAEVNNDSAGSDEACDIILLDRPTDDELVQHFIRHGNTMQAHISGIGDLYHPKSPPLVLRQAAKILDRNGRCWGIASDWSQLLLNLYQMYGR